ncbi:MAG: hypothetical protein HRT89_00240 [Lentisphaeria bacterium]|nr:hypothetical protein [Lentisphaeria bacterium]NQZ66471.1 hypothetical protein [Lentisphaeria bacterium]
MNHRILYLLAAIFVSLSSQAHESPIDHIDRLIKVWIEKDGLHISYQMHLSERQALLQLRAVDTDKNGQINGTEKATYFKSHGEKVASYLVLTLGKKRLPITLAEPVLLRANFSQRYHFVAPMDFKAGQTDLLLTDNYSHLYPGSCRIKADSLVSNSFLKASFAKETEKMRGHGGIIMIKLQVLVKAEKEPRQ